MIEEEIDYARYATFATLRSLRYATLQTEEDRRKNDEGFLLVSDRERESEERKRERTNAIHLRRGDCPQKTEKTTIPKSKIPKGKEEEEEEADMETIASCFETTAITSYLGQSLPNRPLTNRKEAKTKKNLTSLFHNRHPPLPLPRLHHARSPTPGHPHADLPPQSHRLRTPLHNLRRPPIASNLHRLGPQRLQLARRPNLSSMHQHALSTRKSEYPRSRLAYVAGSWRESEM